MGKTGGWKQEDWKELGRGRWSNEEEEKEEEKTQECVDSSRERMLRVTLQMDYVVAVSPVSSSEKEKIGSG